MEKHTKIVATVGPACWDFESLERLALEGVNIFRLNFSHGDHKSHGEVIRRIKRLNQKLKKSCAILLDTKGPEVRTGDVPSPIQVKKGDRIILTIDHTPSTDPRRIEISYDGFIDDVEVGEKILIDSGVITLKVLEKVGKDVICEVLDDGTITSRRHVNLPGRDVSLESITEKDWEDIRFGVEMGVDFIALSFVRRATEIWELKAFLKEQGASRIHVMAKIESFEATKHLGTICEAADAIMVARGDLGAEVPLAEVPRLQREIVEMAGKFRRPVVVATHMLESMIYHPIPTRAEVTDVAEAVWQRADAVMLSGETATGKYPHKAVTTMVDIIKTTEKEALKQPIRDLEVSTNREVFSYLASWVPEKLKDASAIVVITRSGSTAQLVSSLRPSVPIFAFTNTPSVKRKMQILWGVEGFRIAFSSEPEKTIQRAREVFLRHYPDWQGKKYVLISDFLVGEQFVPTLQIREF